MGEAMVLRDHWYHATEDIIPRWASGTGRGQGRRLAVIPEKGSSGAVRGGRFPPSGPRRVSSVASIKKANTSLMNNHLR